MRIRRIEIDADDGAKVVVNLSLRDDIERIGERDLARVLTQLEDMELVVWRPDPTEEHPDRRARREEAIQQIELTSREISRLSLEAKTALERLERYRKLENKGVVVPFNIDSLERMVRKKYRQSRSGY